ncbi:MAG: aminotransferase class V-fold PLP-dependent enzyme, partial [Candidatus Omnitrophica bacterium]|nr:aminotransferase class V-fold PLP-dependent enzyme [Candidatus Omnitrophota bacterium]
MKEIYNFSAGPAVLPKEVLRKAADEMLDYKGCGMSVMEMSHRGSDFMKIFGAAQKNLREIMNIPENYKI